MKVIIGSWIINENVLHKTCGLLKTEMRERSGPAVWCKSTQERIRQKTHVVELKGHSINFLLHIHKVGGITRDWFKNERTKIQSSRGWDILVKTTGSYVSHDATNSAFSLDLPCLGKVQLFQTPCSQFPRNTGFLLKNGLQAQINIILSDLTKLLQSPVLQHCSSSAPPPSEVCYIIFSYRFTCKLWKLSCMNILI